jgi:hypothetical protein
MLANRIHETLIAKDYGVVQPNGGGLNANKCSPFCLAVVGFLRDCPHRNSTNAAA